MASPRTVLTPATTSRHVSPRPLPPSGAAPSGVWLSLGPASALVGVDPDTLRRWADEGRVACFLTPGGHRRFSRRSLERIIGDGTRPAASLARLGATPEHLTAVYRRRYRRSGPPPSSRNGVGGRAVPDARHVVPPAERETFRVEGRRLIDALLRHLDTADGGLSEAAFAEASGLVETLGARLARSGIALTDAVALFVAARQPFLAEVGALGRRRSLDPAQLGTLYERSSMALDSLLLVLVDSHRAAA
jgi:hypothetical protein